jgi:hypothetical protein
VVAEHTHTLESFALSPAGRWCVTAQTGESAPLERAGLRGGDDTIRTTTHDGLVRAWSAKTGARLRELACSIFRDTWYGEVLLKLTEDRWELRAGLAGVSTPTGSDNGPNGTYPTLSGSKFPIDLLVSQGGAALALGCAIQQLRG